MFRRSANSERMRVGGLRAGLFALAITVPGVALAAPAPPLLMDPTYVERSPPARVAGCDVVVAGLTDGRRAPETIGLTGFQSIAAPADREAWLRSVVETGLRARGFTPTFAPAPAAVVVEAVAAETAAADTAAIEPVASAGPDVLTMHIRLRSVWLESMGLNKSGSVVLQMSATRGAQSREAYYRGERVSPNWANGRGEFNEHLDRTFAEALNAIANDLVPMCGGAP